MLLLVVEQLGELRLIDGLLAVVVVVLKLRCLVVALRYLPFYGQRVEEFVKTILDEIVLETRNLHYKKKAYDYL